MNASYPIIMTQSKDHIVVFIPDFNINTQGKDYADACEMAQDAIGLVGIDMEDENQKLPTPSPLHDIKPDGENDIVTFVEVDFAEYRRKNG